VSFMAVVLSRHVTGTRDGRDAGTQALITSVALRNVNARNLCLLVVVANGSISLSFIRETFVG